ncbi:hypothetical protein RZS28_11915 [Methylocapsa polymorpha]|uniref:Uncharacterized protein n=1 Tax=Methylocapsa polymorpha TaxID=3080828 RepID=A0ABZ0HPJ2_9HYPH|nr:hypothetical protein RZS28_11915 [Methylocapsa sp. RX1]
MNWLSVQVTTTLIAGLVSLSTSLVIALATMILTNRKMRRNLTPDFAAERVAREILMDPKSQSRPFRILRHHLSGFTDDELRKILVRAGAVRLTAGGQEVWGLLSRNRKCLSAEEIKEAPATQPAFDCPGPQENQQQQEVGADDELDRSHDSLVAFERLRAEMLKHQQAHQQV